MIVLAIALLALVTLCLYSTRTFDYWKKRGVKYIQPLPIVGTNGPVFLMQKSITQAINETYKKFPNEKIVGSFNCTHPELLIRDPDIIKNVLITDFVHFFPRGIHPHKTVVEPMLRNLFFADGDLWRLLRQRITPAFTSGKLKAMFPLIVERAERLQERTRAAALKGHAIDARDLMARYTTDFIGACGFGIDADSLNEEDSPIRKLGAKVFHFGVKQGMVAAVKEIFPETAKNLKYLGSVEQDVIDLVENILKQRNYKPSGRNDFIDLLLECKKAGTIIGESIEKIRPDGAPEVARLELDNVLMAAQVLVFFAAGFETSSSATSFTLHQLAYHREVQKKLQGEIDVVLAKHNNKLSYEAVKEMTYLEWVFKEAMRMFPSLGFLIRKCSRPYTLTDLNVTIDEGVRVFIPVHSLHNDPQYWDNPEEFRPERFHPDEFNSKQKDIYLPFGIGPRACVGERLGLMQSMAGLAAVLSRFSVEPAPESIRYPVVNPRSHIVQGVERGLPLMFKLRRTTEHAF